MMYILAAETGAGSTGMTAMLETMSSVINFSMTIFGIVLKDPVMSFILAGSLIGVGIMVLRQIKSVAGS